MQGLFSQPVEIASSEHPLQGHHEVSFVHIKQTEPRRLANVSYMFPANCGIVLKMHEDVPCSCKHPISNRQFV